MVSLATITYKNQLTIPREIIKRTRLKNSQKVLIEAKGGNLIIKPLKSRVEELAGSLAHLAKGKPTNWKKIRRETQRIVAKQIAQEGL